MVTGGMEGFVWARIEEDWEGFWRVFEASLHFPDSGKVMSPKIII